MKSFRDLLVWQKAHEITVGVYRITKEFPRDELYGLTAQIRRSASSVGANIAEGCGREGGNAEFERFLQIAMGSTSELEYHILLARDLALIDGKCHENLNCSVIEIKKMLSSLIRKVHSER